MKRKMQLSTQVRVAVVGVVVLAIEILLFISFFYEMYYLPNGFGLCRN